MKIDINTEKVLFALYINSIDTYENCDYDILAIRSELCRNGLPKIDKPIMICDDNISSEFIFSLDNECIISYVTEKNYKYIIPAVIDGGHYVVLKTPIDINLAKELNILVLNMGLSPDKIIMNPDIGGLGYGYEYGYSIIEKIKLEKEDKYLNFPIISEAAIESAKTKEAKESEQNSKMIELSAASGVIAAGANIIAVKHSDNIKILKGLI